ncbi:hypothetical protein F4604DRAFT_1928319 [Suillus subluteus]|nr:hypothetical protein F4604DRAFT_1928319 [Suillus subluteus]
MDSTNLSNFYAAAVADDPPWFTYPDHHYLTSLKDLSQPVLTEAVVQLPPPFIPIKRTCPVVIHALFTHFLHARARLSLMADDELAEFCIPHLDHPLPVTSRLGLVSAYFIAIYGDRVASAIRHPLIRASDSTNCKPQTVTEPFDAHETWFLLPASELACRVEKLSKEDLAGVVHSIPASIHPMCGVCSRCRCASALIQHVLQRVCYLFSLDNYNFLLAVLCIIPFAQPDQRISMILDVLREEYSPLLILRLGESIPTRSHQLKEQCRKVKQQCALDVKIADSEIVNSWPVILSHEVVLQCLRNYRDGTVWKAGSVCAVCSQLVRDVEVIDVQGTPEDDVLPHSLELLCM